MGKFIPAPGHVEIEPLKQEGIIVNTEGKFEEMGKIIAIPIENADSFAEYHSGLRVGDTIFFDSYACRATPEIGGKKHYVVHVTSGGLLGIIKADVETEPV